MTPAPDLDALIAELEREAKVWDGQPNYPNPSKLYRRAADALSTARRCGAWQPIETAPKGKDILVGAFVGGAWFCSVYTITSDFWREDWETTESEPTHWMPLPTAPEATS